jgi:hypothetical protein
VKLPNKPRVPSPNSQREVEDWRILLAVGIGNSVEKVPGAEEGNIPIFDDGGEIEDSGISINQLSGIERITIDTTLTPDDGTVFVDTNLGDITITLEGEDGEQHRVVNVGSSGNVCILASANNINGFSDDEPLYDSENLDLKFESTEGWF